MTFRIKSISFNDGKEFITGKIPLSKTPFNSSGNYYTVIIGNNGIGKSRILSNIIRMFNYIDKEIYPRSLAAFECDYTHSGFDFIIRRGPENKPPREFYKKLPRPSRIFSITNSLSDSFPNDLYMLPSFIREEKRPIEFQKQYYIYFGSRGRANNSSSHSLINKSFDIFFETKKSKVHLAKTISLFEFMNYRPSLTVEFPMKNSMPIKYARRHIKDIIFETMENANKQFRDRILYLSESTLSRVENHINMMSEIDFDDLNDIYQHGIESHNRTIKMTIDLNESLRSISAKQRLIQSLGILFDLGIIGRKTLSFTKNNGAEFSFQKASSGEIGLMSMFLGLIPLLKDNALIVIDEPELSLHPSWQFRYIELLDNIISDVCGCHVIIASHSHFIISDLPPDRSSVITLKDDGQGIIDSEEIIEETHGSSAEDILLNVFNLPSTRNYYLSVLVTNTLEMVSRGERGSEAFNDSIDRLKEIRVNLKHEDPLLTVIDKLISLG